MKEYTYADWKPNIQERPIMTKYEADQALLIELAGEFKANVIGTLKNC